MEETKNDITDFKFSKRPISLKEITRRLNRFFNKEMTYTVVTQWLTEIDAIEKVQVNEHRTIKRPTEKGLQLGLALAVHKTSHGWFRTLVFDETAQRFIVEHIGELNKVATRKGKVSPEEIAAAMQHAEIAIKRE
ncbi:MAG: hypothetical protein IKU17_08675, partial [Clostridia bacterium]|nr:hypothetical protein [Clostridia bacterium]